MRAVVQRVTQAQVETSGIVVGAIGHGLVAFVGAGRGDTDHDVATIAAKVSGLRVFEDEHGKMSRSVLDTKGSVLAISQFTVYGDVRRGRRPSFDDALEPIEAERLFELFVTKVRAEGIHVETGRFRAMMRVLVDNQGPVTILIDSRKTF